MKQQLENLRTTLLEIKPTGNDGFEGLIGVVLSEATGLPFRLAASGTQYGKDGKSVGSQSNVVAFEAKRYDSKISKNEILSKLTELALAPTDVDIWILAATTDVMSQHAEKIEAIEKKDGVSALVLDWGDEEYPPLAVAIAAGQSQAAKFIKAHVSDSAKAKKAAIALKKISEQPGFLAQKEQLLLEITNPSRGLAFAQQANKSWWAETFSNRTSSIGNVGQALCICEDGKHKAYPRDTLVKKLRPFFDGPLSDELVCVLGNEGHGKSWLVAQAWESLPERPLLIFLPADALSSSAHSDVEQIVLKTVIQQIKMHPTPVTESRWLRVFERWRNSPKPDVPRLVIILDGINQRPTVNWRQIIAKFNQWVIAIGGRLIVTSRPAYFKQEIRSGLAEAMTTVSVPEWTDEEMRQILQTNGVESREITASVAASLKNPRILGIAIKLFAKGDLSSTEELSIHRLLFEHIRTASNDDTNAPSASVFVDTLKSHATALREKMHAGETDDLSVVDKSIEATVEGRFFKTLDDDGSKYEIREDGLNIALALALIDEIKKAIRNNRDPISELEQFLDPISALDQTAAVVLAALTIAVVEYPDQHLLASALIGGFLGLQNPNGDEFSGFSILAKQCPVPFMNSAHSALLSQNPHRSNMDWLQNALLYASEDDSSWAEISSLLQSWLRLVNVKKDLFRLSFTAKDSDDPETLQREFEEKISQKIHAFSSAEKHVYDRLEIVDHDPAPLFALAFKLMIRKPLACFADSLVANCFSRKLNSGTDRVGINFDHLIFLNLIDWSETRAALQKGVETLAGDAVSRIGKWTLAAILRSTGDINDASQAKKLVDELTKDRETFPGWRLVEKYCASDPCNPASARPENLDRTLNGFRALDVGTLHTQFCSTQQDQFYRDVLPGVARFEPFEAASKQKQLIADIVGRQDLPLRQGLVSMEPNLALTTRETAEQFLRRWNRDDYHSDESQVIDESENSFIAGQTLLCALPQLSAEQQLSAFQKPTYDGGALLAWFHYLKKPDEKVFAEVLLTAENAGNDGLLATLILWARYSDIVLTGAIKSCLKKVIHHGTLQTRAQVFALAADSRNRELLLEVISNNFSQPNSNREEDLTSWYGSAALLRATELEIISVEHAIERLCPSLVGEALTLLDANCHEQICARIDSCLNVLCGTSEEFAPPVIEVQADEIDLTTPPRASLSSVEAESTDDGLRSLFKHFSEGPEEFNKRQSRLHESFQQFQQSLNPGLARLILGGVRPAAWRVAVASCPQLAKNWVSIFLSLNTRQLALFHNDAMKLAFALSSSKPNDSERLFKVLEKADSAINHVYGVAEYSLRNYLVWASQDSSFIRSYRARLLDNAQTDKEISLIVLSALLKGHEEEIERYVSQKTESEIPAEIARGLMVAGFSSPSKFNDEVLARYENAAGFIGAAAQAAKHAYERNCWSMHWYKEMRQAKSAEEFWAFSVLMLKVVDGRSDIWHDQEHLGSQFLEVFWPSLQQKVKQRIKKWNDKREKKLFGQDAPIELHFK